MSHRQPESPLWGGAEISILEITHVCKFIQWEVAGSVLLSSIMLMKPTFGGEIKVKNLSHITFYNLCAAMYAHLQTKLLSMLLQIYVASSRLIHLGFVLILGDFGIKGRPLCRWYDNHRHPSQSIQNS